MLTLKADKRETKDTNALRARGLIPVIVYGPKEENIALAVSQTEFAKVYEEAGESAMVKLSGDFGEKEALIYGVALDPVTYAPQHADFYVPEKGKKVTVSIPLEFIGESRAVKDLGGTLVKSLHEVEVEAEPANLPHELTVDISALTDFDKTIVAGDITLPAGVSLETDPEEAVASVEAAREEEEETPSEAPDFSSIEVEKKGKEDDGSEEGGSENSKEE